MCVLQQCCRSCRLLSFIFVNNNNTTDQRTNQRTTSNPTIVYRSYFYFHILIFRYMYIYRYYCLGVCCCLLQMGGFLFCVFKEYGMCDPRLECGPQTESQHGQSTTSPYSLHAHAAPTNNHVTLLHRQKVLSRKLAA